MRNVVKAQNGALLDAIARRYNLDADALRQKYWTPTFYTPMIDEREQFRIVTVNVCQKSNKGQPVDQPNPRT